MRKIDANALMNAFREYMIEHHDRIKCASEENCKACENGCLWRKVVSAAPTVDAVEIAHGEWNTIDDDNLTLIGIECSRCNQEYWFEDEPPLEIYNYCPNCGAEMRERKDND